jgi:hypothetical protein
MKERDVGSTATPNKIDPALEGGEKPTPGRLSTQA